MDKIFYFKYVDVSRNTLHDTGYYLYQPEITNDFSNTKYIGFGVGTKGDTYNGEVREFGENQTKINGTNAICLRELKNMEEKDNDLIRAFEQYHEGFYKNMTMAEFELMQHNYVKVKNLRDYVKPEEIFYEQIDFQI